VADGLGIAGKGLRNLLSAAQDLLAKRRGYVVPAPHDRSVDDVGSLLWSHLVHVRGSDDPPSHDPNNTGASQPQRPFPVDDS
jgi:hypothetical protein